MDQTTHKLNLDWPLLREQKQTIIAAQERCPDLFDSLECVLQVLDQLQDQAAEQLGEQAVFGEQSEVNLEDRHG